MKALSILLALSGCGRAQAPSATPASIDGLSVMVDLPAQTVSGKAISIDVRFENASNKQVCFAFGELAVVDYGLGSYGALAISAHAKGGGGSPTERACLVAGQLCDSGVGTLSTLELAPISQAAGEGLLSLSLSIPVFGETCDCVRAQFLEIERKADVKILPAGT